MTQFWLTKRGWAVVKKGKSKRRALALQKDVFKLYTLKNTGEKVLVNESEIFPKKKFA